MSHMIRGRLVRVRGFESEQRNAWWRCLFLIAVDRIETRLAATPFYVAPRSEIISPPSPQDHENSSV